MENFSVTLRVGESIEDMIKRFSRDCWKGLTKREKIKIGIIRPDGRKLNGRKPNKNASFRP